MFGALDDVQPAERHGSHDGAPASAIGTVATQRIDHSLRQIQEQFHRAAVAGGSMLGVYDRAANRFEAHFAAPEV
jgi:hypothetical protein